MMDPNKFRHDVSRYERPNRKFRCGRAAEWGKPCEAGPDGKGGCGGTSECRPAKVGDRYECRRSALFGGPCTDGPNPTGTCSQEHPPCRPRRTIRSVRGLMAIGAFTGVVAVIALLLTIGSGDAARNAITSAGPLTGGHANFTAETGCVACHEPHGEDAGGWFLAAFEEKDISASCTNCHTFGGDATLAHNSTFANDSKSSAATGTSCISCHTEHRGEDFDIRKMSDTQCGTCHEKEISSFNKDHPAFGADFPHDRRTAIRFDHTSHISKHFQDQRLIDVAPKDCTSCHIVDAAEQTVAPAGFDESCATCHADTIPRRELVLLRLPEFEENLIDADVVAEMCGPSAETWEMVREAMDSDEPVAVAEEEDYEAVSVDEPTAASAYLLGTPVDDAAEYGEPMQALIMGLVEDGPSVLADAVDERAGTGAANAMLAGLNTELVRRVSCAWAANLEYEAPSDPDFGGWYGDGVELKYRPTGHGDPVVQAWVNFGTISMFEDDEDLSEVAEAMRDGLLNPKEGVGACVKCHAVSDDGDGGVNVEWQFNDATSRSFTFYSHGAHLNLLNPSGVNLADPEAGCRTCHKINEDAAYGDSFAQSDPHHFESNFNPINQETCAQCHDTGQVRQDCQLCHVYHLDPGFDLKVTRHEEDADGTSD